MKKCRSFSSYVDNIRKYHRSNQVNVCLSMDFEIEFFKLNAILLNTAFFFSLEENTCPEVKWNFGLVFVAAIFSIFFSKIAYHKRPWIKYVHATKKNKKEKKRNNTTTKTIRACVSVKKKLILWNALFL